MTTKKIALPIFIILSCISLWYLFLKANDFEVVINVKTAPGTVYQNVLNWNKNLNIDTTRTTIIEKKPFYNIVNTYNFKPYNLEFDWKITKTNDSITNVQIGVNDLNHSTMSRIKKLFGTSPLEAFLNQEFSGFNQVLTQHANGFKVSVDGHDNSPEAYVAYVSISCDQQQKANKMIDNSTYINTFLRNNNIRLRSNPFVEITEWDINNETISFNFCFPIPQQTDFPSHDEIKYKKVAPRKAVKATFYGNYSFTDNAWYTLYQYAKDHNLTRGKTITEVFYDNPHVGVKDDSWKAEIYMELE